MTASDATASDPTCSLDDTIFTTFERQQRSPRLDRIRGNIYRNFLLLPRVNLNAAEKAAQEAISRVMAGPFGQAIEHQVLASFHYLAHLRSLLPSQTARLMQLVGHLSRDLPLFTPKIWQ